MYFEADGTTPRRKSTRAEDAGGITVEIRDTRFAIGRTSSVRSRWERCRRKKKRGLVGNGVCVFGDV